MKFRTDFVTNSSSSGFVSVTINTAKGKVLTDSLNYGDGPMNGYFAEGDIFDYMSRTKTCGDIADYLSWSDFGDSALVRSLRKMKNIDEINSISIIDEGENDYGGKWDIDETFHFINSESDLYRFNKTGHSCQTNNCVTLFKADEEFLKYLEKNGWKYAGSLNEFYDNCKKTNPYYDFTKQLLKTLKAKKISLLIINGETENIAKNGEITPAMLYALNLQPKLSYQIIAMEDFCKFGQHILDQTDGEQKVQEKEQTLDEINPDTKTEWDFAIKEDGTVEITKYLGGQTDIEIPESINNLTITSIGKAAFSKSSTIKRVQLPEKINSIGMGSFSFCSALETIVLPFSLNSIGEYAFAFCSNLKAIDIPQSVTSIGKGAFAGCSSFSQIEMPGTIKVINSAVFRDCNHLTKISIPSGVVEIQDEAFLDCTSLQELVLPNSLEFIGTDAFAGCSSLKELHITEATSEIKPGAFSGCSDLSRITVDGNNRFFEGRNNCLINKAEKNVIAGCSTSIIPTDDSVISIGEAAFYNCNKLTEIAIPENIVSIEANAFGSCPNLVDVFLTENITFVASTAFKDSIPRLHIKNNQYLKTYAQNYRKRFVED